MSGKNQEGNPSASESGTKVHFSGRWDDEEKSLIHATIQVVEPIREVDSFDGYTWICTKVEVKESNHFFATRINSAQVHRSTSVDALARQIQDRWG